VTVEALQSIQVACQPYGGVGDLTCLPSAVNFSVHCQALGTFTRGGPGFDVTDQVTWSSSNAAVAQSTGLVAFNGPIRQSFRIVGPTSGTGTAILKATQSGKTSPVTGTPGIDPWAVQGVLATVTDLDVTPPSGNVGVNDTLQVTATATVSGAVPACATPQPRDFSRAVTWTSTNEGVADVSFFGEVTGVASGNATITAGYGFGNPPRFRATSAITVVP
jgi:Bacterial Ig-like domain (group 2)